MPTFAPKARPLAISSPRPAKSRAVQRPAAGSQLRWQYHHQSGPPRFQRGSTFDQHQDAERALPEEEPEVGTESPTPLQAPPSCAPGPLLRCQCLDLGAARQFAIQKLSQTTLYVGRWAAAMQRGRLGFAMPRNLRAELTGGANAVVERLRTGSINIACDRNTSSGNVGQYVHPNDILLTIIAVQPPWTQRLLEKVVLHEALHAVCAHLPSQPGRDPYDQASRLGLDNNTVMHEDLTAIMRAFPDNTPLW